jgi:hypothetical protein
VQQDFSNVFQQDGSGIQLIELPQFVSADQTAFQLPQTLPVTSSVENSVAQHLFYTNSAFDASNVIHEFLPQMAVFLPQQSEETKISTSQSKPSYSRTTGSSKKDNSVKNKDEKEVSSPPKKKFISPFAPEATVPLPCQLDELG